MHEGIIFVCFFVSRRALSRLDKREYSQSVTIKCILFRVFLSFSLFLSFRNGTRRRRGKLFDIHPRHNVSRADLSKSRICWAFFTSVLIIPCIFHFLLSPSLALFFLFRLLGSFESCQYFLALCSRFFLPLSSIHLCLPHVYFFHGPEFFDFD